MRAVVVKVRIGDVEVAAKELHDEVVPRVSQSPGFVAGYWTRSAEGDDGLSMVLFESEDAARAAAERIRGGPIPDTVTMESVEIREVVEHA
jgi:heme-degrading monooxygenase HmoA